MRQRLETLIVDLDVIGDRLAGLIRDAEEESLREPLIKARLVVSHASTFLAVAIDKLPPVPNLEIVRGDVA